jgi:hypothetical protein
MNNTLQDLSELLLELQTMDKNLYHEHQAIKTLILLRTGF